MSHLSKIRMRINNREALINALEQMFGRENVQQYETPVKIKGWGAYHKGEIIIPAGTLKKQGYIFGYDIGFSKNSNGEFDAISDRSLLNWYYPNFENRLFAEYAKKVVEQQISQMPGARITLIEEKDFITELEIEILDTIQIGLI